MGGESSATVINLAAAISAARARGARLIVVDPRRIGLAAKADLLLQVRPGTDGALAGVRPSAYRRGLVRRRVRSRVDERRCWCERTSIGSCARTRSPPPGNAAAGYVAWHRARGRLVHYTPRRGYGVLTGELALRGALDVELADGRRVTCRPVFDVLAELAARFPPAVAAEITGVPAPMIREAVRLMVENRPVSHHAWNGIVLHTNATQTARAIEVFYALLGDWDRPGETCDDPRRRQERSMRSSPSPRRSKPGGWGSTSGRSAHPRSPATSPRTTSTPPCSRDSRTARALLSFGSNTLVNAGDPRRGRAAFEQLEFFAAVELFHTPTTRYADVVLPAASFLEKESCRQPLGSSRTPPAGGRAAV